MIPLHKFLKGDNELYVPFSIAQTVAQLKNAGGSIYVNEEECHPVDDHEGTDTIYVTLHQDDPLMTLDYILKNMNADEMSVEKHAETNYIRLWYD